MSQAHDPSQADTILLAEDNEDHIFFIKRSFMHARFLNPVQVTRDGVQTIAYLRGDGKYSDRSQYPFPTLLLLDLKMPNKDGFEVLEWIRQQAVPAIARLRVVVLTTSDRIFDVKRAYSLGAIGFLTKPLNLHEFIQLGPAIKGFWLWNGSDAASADGAVPQPVQQAPAGTPLAPVLQLPDLSQPPPTPPRAPPQHAAA